MAGKALMEPEVQRRLVNLFAKAALRDAQAVTHAHRHGLVR